MAGELRNWINVDSCSHGVFQIKRDARYLIPILDEWVTLVQRYVRYAPKIIEGDVPWWYTERCHGGLLSAALWRNGCMVLEERHTERGDKGSRGRTDLYVVFPEFLGKERTVLIETKVAWYGIDEKDLVGKLTKSIQFACNDAKNNRDKANRRYGALFWVPPVVDKSQCQKN